MAADPKNDRKKIAINENTYEQLKTFSRFNGLKLRLVIDAMTDAMLNDEVLANRIIDKAVALHPDKDKD